MPIVRNHLIELLPRKDRLSLLALCKPVELVLAAEVCDLGKPTRHVYFPTESFISLVSQIDGSPRLEVGMVEREGMLGAQLAFGVVTAPLHAVVQGAGASLRVTAANFRIELARSLALQRVLNRYLYALMVPGRPRACASTGLVRV